MKISILDDYFDTLRTLACFQQARRPRRDDLERPRPGRRCAGRAAAGYRGAGADPRAHQDPRAAAGAAAAPQAHQPAQRLSAYRHRHLHAARHHRVVEPASRHAVLRHGRDDLGADPRRHAANPAADGLAQGRQLADGRGHDDPRQDARHLRLRPHRQRGRGLRQGVRHERAGLGARGDLGAGAGRRLGHRAAARRSSSRAAISSRCTCGWSMRRATSSPLPISPA